MTEDRIMRDKPFLDEAPDDAEGVMNGSLRFLQHEFVRTSHYDGDHFAWVLYACHLQPQESQLRQPWIHGIALLRVVYAGVRLALMQWHKMREYRNYSQII